MRNPEMLKVVPDRLKTKYICRKAAKKLPKGLNKCVMNLF